MMIPSPLSSSSASSSAADSSSGSCYRVVFFILLVRRAMPSANSPVPAAATGSSQRGSNSSMSDGNDIDTMEADVETQDLDFLLSLIGDNMFAGNEMPRKG